MSLHIIISSFPTLHGETCSGSEYPGTGFFPKPIPYLQTFPLNPLGNGELLVVM